jgi:phosphatidylserine decarboxylase
MMSISLFIIFSNLQFRPDERPMKRSLPKVNEYSVSGLELVKKGRSIISTYSRNHEKNLSMFSIPLEKWACSNFSSPANVKVFVYDNLHPNLTTRVEECLIDLYINTIYLFRTMPSRTFNPNDADIFVVPYAAEGHCQCAKGYSWNCAQVPQSDIELLRLSLIYLNETTKSRHLFILAGARAKPYLWSKPFLLTTAPSTKRGQIVIPNLEDKLPYQPSSLLRRPTEWWTLRRRKYSFSFLYGGRNPKMKGGGRKFRDYLEADIAANYPSGILNGQPFLMKRWSSPHDFHKLDTFSIYNDSILCPCLPGDLSWQKRFFDVILNGCLPVVLKFDTPGLPGGKSWFLPEGEPGEIASVLQTYPFAKGIFGNRADLEIDYESFVVEIPIDTYNQENVTGILKTMEAILNNEEELRRRQRAMMKASVTFSYGMGYDAHKYDDAFSHILKAIRYYLDHEFPKP